MSRIDIRLWDIRVRIAATVALSLVLFLHGVTTPAAAQTLRTGEVDDYIRAEMKRQQIPGLALLVAQEGKTVCAQGYGLANVELQVPVKAETLFQSGSVASNSPQPPS